jgi:hypothetical protein
MFFLFATVITLAVLAYTFLIRSRDIPEPAPATPYHHLETRKATIYENLRDLQFEYRVGKLSDADYQRTKQELQSELAGVLAEIDRLKQNAAPAAQAAPASGPAAKAGAKSKYVCTHCGAGFDKQLRFCGECGKPMGAKA